MFKYDKKINNWSNKMIKNINVLWGTNISRNKPAKKPRIAPYLIDYLNQYLNKYGKTIIKRFNRLTGLSFSVNNFKYYINNTPVSLHNSEKLYISISCDHSFAKYPTVLIHEISHIYFYKYIETSRFLKSNKISKVLDLISKKEKNELKEIITVIINSEFADIIDRPDEGYKSHKKIRKKIFKLWIKKHQKFDEFIVQVIRMYKKMGVAN